MFHSHKVSGTLLAATVFGAKTVNTVTVNMAGKLCIPFCGTNAGLSGLVSSKRDRAQRSHCGERRGRGSDGGQSVQPAGDGGDPVRDRMRGIT
jgi:hypothetical protein